MADEAEPLLEGQWRNFHVRLFGLAGIVTLLLAGALGALVFVVHLRMGELAQQHLEFTELIRRQTWILSLPPADRPCLDPPISILRELSERERLRVLSRCVGNGR